MTEFELIGKDKRTGRQTFLITKTTPAIVNAIRRASTDLVTTMAIDTVEFQKNSGALYDEMIALRLGLIPLKTDLKSYVPKEQCKCGGVGCQNCTLKLSLKGKGPGYVYSSELQSQDPKVTPVFDKIPITKLLKNQELELVATAKLGTGKEHAKFVPGLVWYTYKPTLKINNDHPRLEEFKDRYPKIAFKNGKLDADEIEKHHLYESCEGINKDILDVTYDEHTIIMHVEPWGQLSPKEILMQALGKLGEELAKLEESLT